MNLAALRTAVRTRLGNPSTDGFFSDANLTDLVNDANQALSVEADWPWLEDTATLTTVSGTQSYTPPTDGEDVWVKTLALTPSSETDNALVLRSLIEVRELGDIEGEATIYTISGDKILLGPTPNTVRTYHHDYIKMEPILSDDEDTPILPSMFQYPLIHLACAFAHLRQNDRQMSESWMLLYNGWLTRMRDNRRRTSAFPRIRIRPGSML